MSVIRGTALAGFGAFVTELGGQPKPVLYAAGIRPDDAGDPDAFLAYRSIVLAVEAAAEQTGCLDFGRQLALRQGIDILGPVGVAARTAPTVGGALTICSLYLASYSLALTVALVPTSEPDRTLLELRLVAPDLPAHPQTYELSLGVALQVLRYICGPNYAPAVVQLPHAAVAQPTDYVAYFGCPVRFEQPDSGLALRTRDLAGPVSADALAHEAVVRYLDSLVRDVHHGVAGPVRELVRRLLPTGATSMELVAAQFALHPKTLQRRLAGEGTTFAELVDATRRAQAERLLRDTDLSMSQVAREIGYAEQSVLTRSSRRWFGPNPTAARTALRAVS